jgi:glycosyltransferase involved in cell wall biosynthesis
LAVTHPYSWPEVRRGAERIIVETARALADRGHVVTIFTAGEAASRTAEGGVTTVKFRRLFEDPGRHERWFGLRVLPHLVRGRFDAVHAMMVYDGLAAVRARRITGHRVIYEELGNPFRWYWDLLPDRAVRERLVRDVDVYGCMSRYSLDVLSSEWGRQGALIPGGVRLSEFHPARTRQPVPTVLFSAALDEPRKGLGHLLAAAALLVERHPDLQIWLSGSGDPTPLLAAADRRVADRVSVLPLGDPKDLSTRYAEAWVTTLPSTGDSFGMTLIESLASGTPIVVADDGAPLELVTPLTGSVARANNPASLCHALEQGMALAKEPGTPDHCRAAAARFDWDDSIAPALELLYAGG